MRHNAQVVIRLPSGLMQRLDALIAPLESEPHLAHASRSGAGPRDRPGPRGARARCARTAAARFGRSRSLKRNEAARRGR